LRDPSPFSRRLQFLGILGYYHSAPEPPSAVAPLPDENSFVRANQKKKRRVSRSARGRAVGIDGTMISECTRLAAHETRNAIVLFLGVEIDHELTAVVGSKPDQHIGSEAISQVIL
jgi:hypothetical protein